VVGVGRPEDEILGKIQFRGDGHHPELTPASPLVSKDVFYAAL
jgi:hypothetical protein